MSLPEEFDIKMKRIDTVIEEFDTKLKNIMIGSLLGNGYLKTNEWGTFYMNTHPLLNNDDREAYSYGVYLYTWIYNKYTNSTYRGGWYFDEGEFYVDEYNNKKIRMIKTLIEGNGYRRHNRYYLVIWINNSLNDVFYNNKILNANSIKIIPENIEDLLNGEVLAYMYMEVGSMNMSNDIILGTEKFNKTCVERLQKAIENKFIIDSILEEVKVKKEIAGYRLKISGKNSRVFRELIEPYLIGNKKLGLQAVNKIPLNTRFFIGCYLPINLGAAYYEPKGSSFFFI